MKLLVLVIACNSGSDDKWLHLCRSRKYPDWVTIRYIFLDPNLPEKFKEEGDSLIMRGKECRVPGILVKTKVSMEYCLQTMDFDMLLRTNISSFFKFNDLLEFLHTIPSTNHIAGPMLYDYVRFYPSGCGYIMTRDVVERFVHWDRDEYIDDKIGFDDTEIGIFMHSNKIPFTIWNLTTFHPNKPVEDMKGFHLRFKSDVIPERRDLDLKGFEEAIHLFD